MLRQEEIPYRYREYTQEPLSAAEIREVLDKLGVAASAVLRRRDPAFKALGLTGDESDSVLVGHMADHPTLLERPIGLFRSRAVVGRPPEQLVGLVRGG